MPALLLLIFAVVTGCRSTINELVKNGNSETIVTAAARFDNQDASVVAAAVVRGLLESGVLDKVPQPPGVLTIQRIVNSTSQILDFDTLKAKIRVALLASGKVLLISSEAFPSADKVSPTLFLNGKILESVQKSRFAATREIISKSTYTANFCLTDTKGVILWEGEKEIIKVARSREVFDSE